MLVALCWVFTACAVRDPTTPASNCPAPLPNPTDFGDGPVLGVEGVEVRRVIPVPFVFPCATLKVEVELTAPDGSIGPVTDVDVSGPSTEVRFTPTQPGTWVMRARWSTGDSSERRVLVAPLVRAGPRVLRRFVDPMDNCERAFRLNSGQMACQRAGEIHVYGADGQLLVHFPGRQLAVRGDELWSSANGALEHRTGLPGMLRFDGSVPMLTMGAESVTLPGLAIRADVSKVIEVRWDGTTLTSSTIAEGFSIPEGFILTQAGGETWIPTGCRVERGCPTGDCPPMYTCREQRFRDALSIEPEVLWSLYRLDRSSTFSSVQLTATKRPLDFVTPSSGSIDLVFESGINRNSSVPTLERPYLGSDGFLFFPHQPTPDTIAFVAVEDPGITVSVTPEWMVSRTADPFTLLSTQTPAIP